MIEDCILKTTDVTDIYIYINKEFSESRTKDKRKHDYQIEIEEYGISKEIQIE